MIYLYFSGFSCPHSLCRTSATELFFNLNFLRISYIDKICIPLSQAILACDMLGKRQPQLLSCLHQIVLWAFLCGNFLNDNRCRRTKLTMGHPWEVTLQKRWAREPVNRKGSSVVSSMIQFLSQVHAWTSLTNGVKM